MENPVEEAKRIIAVAEELGIVLRLFGGVGYYLRCPSAKGLGLQREYVDVDFMAHPKQTHKIKRLFTDLGYVPRERFNALQGYRRLVFNDIENRRRVDVFLDVFEMCHRFDFKDRLEIDRYTISLADLLATKLQIIEINEKDIKDMVSLLIDHEVGEDDSPEAINGVYLAKLAGDDWGVYRTFQLNLERLESASNKMELDDYRRRLVIGRIDRIRSLIAAAPKGIRWRIRARIGERIRWYELPEVDNEAVESRMITGNGTLVLGH